MPRFGEMTAGSESGMIGNMLVTMLDSNLHA